MRVLGLRELALLPRMLAAIAVMPADFLTKWVDGKKTKKSVEYATNFTVYVAA